MNKDKYIICTIWFLICIANISAYFDEINYFRYIRYVSPLLLLFISSKNISSSDINYRVLKGFDNLYYTLKISCLVTLVVTFIGYWDDRVLFNCLILLLPIKIVISTYQTLNLRELKILLEIFFWGLVIQFSLVLIKDGVFYLALTNLNFFAINDLIYESKHIGESISPLCFSFFAIYFFDKKNYRNFLVALLFIAIGGKRVVWGGLFLAFLFMFLMRISRFDIFSLNRKWFKLYFAFLIFFLQFYQLYSGKGIFDLIETFYPQSNYSIEEFSMGRSNLASTLIQKVNFSDISFHGIGLGSVENILKNNGDVDTSLVHNELLRLFVEMGPFIFIYFIYAILSLFGKSKLYFNILILLFTIMITDNIFLYIEVMLSFYLVVTVVELESFKRHSHS